jgi:hypothetical protein
VSAARAKAPGALHGADVQLDEAAFCRAELVDSRGPQARLSQRREEVRMPPVMRRLLRDALASELLDDVEGLLFARRVDGEPDEQLSARARDPNELAERRQSVRAMA